VAEVRGVLVRELASDGEHALDRLASLVAVGDFASVYLAVGSGTDPTPIAPIDELKERIAP
jgi:glucose/mannose-6-phosphate isomerase